MNRIRSALTGLLVIVLLCVPKSGAYVAGAPVYLLYVLMLSSVPLGLLISIAPRGGRRNDGTALNNTILLLSWFPFWLCWWAAFAQFGYTSFPEFAGQVFAVFVCPLYFLILFGPWMAAEQARIERIIRVGLRLVVVYGLISFAIGAMRGRYPELAYLTEPGGESPFAAWQRNNLRGDFLKLISTYTNGNIYGVCMLMLLPVYLQLEEKWFWRALFVTSVLATLSRTVWAGLAFFMVLRIVRSKSHSKLLLAVLGAFVVGVAVLSVGQLFGGASFVFNSSLGGRAKYFSDLQTFNLLPVSGIGKIREITYLSYYKDFGLVGVLGFVLFLLAPILAYMGRRSRGNSPPPIASAAVDGLVVYMFCSLSDGAFVYVPTFAIYCFVAAITVWSHEEVRHRAERNARGRDFAGWGRNGLVDFGK